MASLLAVAPAFDAASAASAIWAVASERAASRTGGPGSFAVAFLDELAAIQPADLDGRVRVDTEVAR
jgi:hydroxyethylthiazole kinase